MDSEELAAQAGILDTLPLAGFPKEEGDRRRAWAKIPRRVRSGIRGLHSMMGHKLKEVHGSGALAKLIDAAKIFKCETCRVSDENTRTHLVTASSPYEFNHTVAVDVLAVDSTGEHHSWLNMVDMGTCYQVVCHVRTGVGQSTSSKCWERYLHLDGPKL